jgi:hypothetical protein
MDKEREKSPVEIGRDKYIASLTPEQRSEKARKAAKIRHNKTINKTK